MVVIIPITINGSTKETLISGVHKVISQIRPEWNLSEIKSHVYTNGITNKLVGIWNENVNNQILVRVSGDNTEKFIDRENEVQSMELMFKHGCGPQVYGKFENGLAYSFIPGRPLTADCVNIDQIWNGVAKAMATIHRIKVREGKVQLFQKMKVFFDLLPPTFKDEQEERLKCVGLSKEFLKNEMNDLQLHLEGLNCPMVLSHNDILLQNIIWDEENCKIGLIDFEYTFVNYQPFDIGNHFNEFAGVETVDYSRYPSADYQRRWIRRYLSYYHATKESDIEDSEVETMRVWANKFALASHLFWGFWALVQSHLSPLDFDFTGYAILRLCEYKNRKEEFLALRVPVKQA